MEFLTSNYSHQNPPISAVWNGSGHRGAVPVRSGDHPASSSEAAGGEELLGGCPDDSRDHQDPQPRFLRFSEDRTGTRSEVMAGWGEWRDGAAEDLGVILTRPHPARSVTLAILGTIQNLNRWGSRRRFLGNAGSAVIELPYFSKASRHEEGASGGGDIGNFHTIEYNEYQWLLRPRSNIRK